MDAERAKQLFKQADELYLNRQYKEAVVLLAELNQAFPNQKNVLWPSALCLNKLGRHAEALRLCDALSQYFNDERAADLRVRIQAQLQAQSAPSLPQDMLDGGLRLDDIDAMIDRPAPAPREPLQAAPDYKKWALIGGGVLLVLAVIILPLLGGAGSGANNGIAPIDAVSINATGFDTSKIDTQGLKPNEVKTVQDIAAVAAVGASTARLMVVLIMFSVFLAQVLAMYCTFSLIGKLPSTDFTENMQDILLYAIIFSALSFVPIVGFIASLVIMSRHYQLSCGELMIAWIVIAVLTFGFIMAGAVIFGLSLAGVASAA